MTAWQEIQLDWAQKTEQGLVTGVLLWDLSAAFDTLDCDGLCDKLVLFGVLPRSVRRVRSFLCDRSQRVISIWNVAPAYVTDSINLYQVKKESIKFVKTLPI